MNYLPDLEISKLLTYTAGLSHLLLPLVHMLFEILTNMSLIEKSVTRFFFFFLIQSGFMCPLLWNYLKKHMWATLNKWMNGKAQAHLFSTCLLSSC